MTYPSFVQGEKFRSADANAIGLWLVTTQTIGTAVSSVTVSSCFSSTYDNYLIQVVGGAASADDNGKLTLGSTATGYYGTLMYATYAAGGTFVGAADNNAAAFSYVWRHNTGGLEANITILGPNLAKPTFVEGTWVPTTAAGRYQGIQNSTTQFTSFTLATTTGTLTGGTIRVYGYRN